MESLSHKRQQEELRQAEIRKQIAALQAQLVDVSNTPPQSPPRKRPQDSAAVLAPASPSPSELDCCLRCIYSLIVLLERRRLDKLSPITLPAKQPASRPKTSNTAKQAAHIPKPAPSTLVTKLASISAKSNQPTTIISHRSSGFSERPPAPREQPEEAASHVGASRDDSLTLIEDLEIGPTEHQPPFDDPQFLKLEPNSGIRLS